MLRHQMAEINPPCRRSAGENTRNMAAGCDQFQSPGLNVAEWLMIGFGFTRALIETAVLEKKLM
jgi:hypothetical protein